MNQQDILLEKEIGQFILQLFSIYDIQFEYGAPYGHQGVPKHSCNFGPPRAGTPSRAFVFRFWNGKFAKSSDLAQFQSFLACRDRGHLLYPALCKPSLV